MKKYFRKHQQSHY